MITGLQARSFPTLSDELLRSEKQYETKLLNGLIMRACDPDPDKRFQSAEEFLAAVHSVQKEIEHGPKLFTRRRAIIAGSGNVAVASLSPVVSSLVHIRRSLTLKWTPLFDGKTLDGWISEDPPYTGTWFVEEGAIRCKQDERYKSLHTIAKFQYGRYRATMTPDHDRARLGLTYGHPQGSHFLFYEDKYLWLRNSKSADAPEQTDRWRSFPRPMIPGAGQSVTMELDWGPDRTLQFINGEMLQEVPGLPQAGTLGLHVWGMGKDSPTGDSGRFQDIEFTSLL